MNQKELTHQLGPEKMINVTRTAELRRITHCLSMPRPAGCRGADDADASRTQEPRFFDPCTPCSHPGVWTALTPLLPRESLAETCSRNGREALLGDQEARDGGHQSQGLHSPSQGPQPASKEQEG